MIAGLAGGGYCIHFPCHSLSFADHHHHQQPTGYAVRLRVLLSLSSSSSVTVCLSSSFSYFWFLPFDFLCLSSGYRFFCCYAFYFYFVICLYFFSRLCFVRMKKCCFLLFLLPVDGSCLESRKWEEYERNEHTDRYTAICNNCNAIEFKEMSIAIKKVLLKKSSKFFV